MRAMPPKKLKQSKIADFFKPESSACMDEFYAELDKYTTTREVSRAMPTIENVRRRFGRNRVNEYKALLSRAEDADVQYFMDRKENMNARTIDSRCSEMLEIIESIYEY